MLAVRREPRLHSDTPDQNRRHLISLSLEVIALGSLVY